MADVAAKERKILVAVDEGEESMHALSWCLKNVISENSKDTLVLLYVKPPPCRYLFSADIMAAVDKYSNDLAECVVEKAKKMCKDIHDVKVETRIEHGDPRDVICQMTEKLGADMLVMGSHGYGLIKRALLGSVSNHCAQNVKCQS
ncbi:universal stress protein a-like protein [Quercus suber]|uniref:Universal stress protein a-like protein n=1 Tax=Quercus suber TaxID=58331 RepID=A0AAW0KMU6_QUESU